MPGPEGVHVGGGATGEPRQALDGVGGFGQAVARSLEARDGTSLAHGLALWERYTRAAVVGLEGARVLVVDYDAALAEPA
ncbi:MAG: hypothetical protein AAGK32_11340, partial [Actinomycetota bacterium]